MVVGYRIGHLIDEIASVAELVGLAPDEFGVVLRILNRIHLFWEDSIGRTNHIQQDSKAVRPLCLSCFESLGVMSCKQLRTEAPSILTLYTGIGGRCSLVLVIEEDDIYRLRERLET